MRCLDKLTTWVVRLTVVASSTLACLPCAAATTPTDPQGDGLAEIRAAMIAAVRQRLAGGAEVTVEHLQVRGDFAGLVGVVATVDAAAKLGTRMRFALKASRGRSRGSRVGEADAVIRARLTLNEVVTPLRRGDVIAASQIRKVTTWADGLRLRPSPVTVVGARAVRPLVPGDFVLASDVVAMPTIKNGSSVRLVVAVGDLEVSLEGVAAQDGNVGEDIQVVNPSSGRTIRGRVMGPQRVEVQHGS